MVRWSSQNELFTADQMDGLLGWCLLLADSLNQVWGDRRAGLALMVKGREGWGLGRAFSHWWLGYEAGKCNLSKSSQILKSSFIEELLNQDHEETALLEDKYIKCANSKKYERCGNSSFNTHIVALCVALRCTQTAVGSQTGITMVGMAMTLTSGQKTERQSQGSSNKEETQ